jgi:TolA-binding protein
MKRLAFLFFFLTGASGAFAQTFSMKSGETVPASEFVRNGDMLMVTVKSASGGSGQVGYHISDVASLNLPEPDVMVFAAEQLQNKEYQNALNQIMPVVAFQKTIRDIPGNWWAKAALLEASALIGLNRVDDATALVTEISSYANDPEILTAAKLQIALITKYTDPKQAMAAYDDILSHSSDAKTLSQAWIAEGDVHFSEHEFDEALMAYLTVTVFYPEHNPFLPKALFGAGQSYAKLKDTTNATKVYNSLIANFPESPEAPLARAELAEIKKKENKT